MPFLLPGNGQKGLMVKERREKYGAGIELMVIVGCRKGTRRGAGSGCLRYPTCLLGSVVPAL